MKSINKKIVEYLREKNISQYDVAIKAGMAPSNFSRLLNSDDLRVSHLIEITRALGISTSYFFDGQEQLSVEEISGDKKRISELENELSIFRSVVNKKIFDYISLLLSDAFKKESKQIKVDVLKRHTEWLKNLNYPISIVTFELDDHAKDELYDAVSSAIQIIKKEIEQKK